MFIFCIDRKVFLYLQQGEKILRKMILFVLRIWLFSSYGRSHYNTNAVAKPFVVVVLQSLSRARLFATQWTAAHQASLSLTTSQSSPKFMFIASVMPSGHFILWCPLLLLPSVFPNIRDFSSESSVCIRWPNYWSFSFVISPSSDYSGLISLKIDWFDLLAVQGTFNSLL